MGAALVGFVPLYFPEVNGLPVNGLQLFCYIAGTSTKQNTFSDSDLTVANTNPILIGADGRPPDPIFTSPTGYKFVLAPATDTDPPTSPIWTVDNWSDPGYIFSASYGTLGTAGALNVTTYTVLDTDRLVTVDSSGSPTITLPAAADFSASVTIKNMNTGTVTISPDGTDTIDGLAAAYVIAASASPLFRAVTLVSDGVSAWWVVGSVGV